MSQSTVADLLKDKAQQAQSELKRGLFSIAPDTAVAEAVSAMARHEISSMIVIDAGEMVGLITLRELLQGLNTQGGNLMQAKCRTVMKTNPPVAKSDDSVDHLRGLMTELHITHVPVVDHGVLAGILSFHDIARSAIKDVSFENQLLKQYIKNWPE
ncbi:MAG: CBS domain-containing protein [Burkholderiales bacterium]|nr:CBS domain-containing protein [Burkholderiales bacterium]